MMRSFVSSMHHHEKQKQFGRDERNFTGTDMSIVHEKHLAIGKLPSAFPFI